MSKPENATGPSDYEEQRIREVHRLREWMKYIHTKLRKSDEPPSLRKSQTLSQLTRALTSDNVPGEWDELKP